MERSPRFRRLRFAPPAVMHGLPSPMALDAVAGLMAIRPMEQSLPTHNRASGCNFYNLALTTNVVQSATWGYADESSIQSQPWSGCRPCCRENSRPVRTPVLEDGHGPWVALRLPTAKCLAKARHHAFQATWRMIFSRIQNFDTPSIIIASSPNTSLRSLGAIHPYGWMSQAASALSAR